MKGEKLEEVIQDMKENVHEKGGEFIEGMYTFDDSEDGEPESQEEGEE